MALIIVIDVLVVLVTIAIALLKGFESVLPWAAFACILAPIEPIPLPGLFALTTQRILLIVLLVLYLTVGRRKTAASQLNKNPLKWLMIAQVTWALISTANSIDPVMSIKKLLSEVAEYYIFYLIYLKSVTSTATIYRILNAMIAAMFVCCVFGSIEAYAGWRVMSLFPARLSPIQIALGMSGESNDGRIAATFPHPILFGVALAMTIIVALHLLRVADSAKKRVLLWTAILLMFSNIYKSFSRGPWLGLMFGLVLLLFLERGKIRRYLLVLGALAGTVLIVRPGVYNSIKGLYQETLFIDWNNPKGLSYEYRYELRRVAMQALNRNVSRQLWGYGMESFAQLGLEGELAGHPFPFLSCDSGWIQLMVETGYVGLVLIALVLLKPAWCAWMHFWKNRGPERYFSVTAFICMASYYFMMMSVDAYGWGQEGYMLWILIALSIAHRRHTKPVLKRRPPLHFELELAGLPMSGRRSLSAPGKA